MNQADSGNSTTVNMATVNVTHSAMSPLYFWPVCRFCLIIPIKPFQCTHDPQSISIAMTAMPNTAGDVPLHYTMYVDAVVSGPLLANMTHVTITPLMPIYTVND